MVEITAETFAKYCIYNIIDKEHNLTKQQIKKYKTHESELIKDKIFMYAHEDIITPTTMHCRVSTPKTIEFRSKLGFNQYDITLSKEQSLLIPLMDAFEEENMQTHCSVLGYRIIFIFMTINLEWKSMKRVIRIEILTMK